MNRRYTYSSIFSLLFIIVTVIAIMVRIFLKEGLWPSLAEVIRPTPLLCFLLIWGGLAFFCTYGLYGEYAGILSTFKSKYPDLSFLLLKKHARIVFLYKYSKCLLWVLLGLPIAISAFDSVNDTSTSIVCYGILLIIFIFDLFACLALKRKIRIDSP